jgi:hypothetical protein
MKSRFTLALTVPLLGAPVWAADLSVKFDLPQLTVAEYHKPYVAVWIERQDQTFVANLNVLYDVKKRDNGGTKWLKDMRQWWRKSGRDLTMPVDGVSGATRAPGEHTLAYAGAKSPLDKLAPGSYQVVVEAAREAGGREVVRVPFQWPPANAAQAVSAQGKEELGTVSVALKP